MGVAVKRGCGVREPGGAYIETLTSSHGMPIEHFLLDPPVPIAPGFNLPNRGVSIVPRPGTDPVIFDVYDRVGESGYPNVADFIEETRRYGLSRRIGVNQDFSLLSAGSRIVLAHPRAIVPNAEEIYMALVGEHLTYKHRHSWECICNQPQHATLMDIPGFETCASLWYELVTGGDESYDPNDYPRTVDRTIGSIRYKARHRPHEVEPLAEDGFFLRLPIHQIGVINDPAQKRHVSALERAATSGLPVQLQDA